MTECKQLLLGFHPSGARKLTARFDGGSITSDGGALLLRQVEESTGLLLRFSQCFRDHRDPELIEHSVYDLIAQRIYGLALGYEDLNDHDTLRCDPLLALLVGKSDLTGEQRVRRRDVGKPLAGKSTLNRLELTPVRASADSRYKKITADCSAIERLLVEQFLLAHSQPPRRIVLDLDATDDPVHGHQLGAFFHGYYRHYCFLPLYIFCGEHCLCARLRPSNIDASAGALTQVKRIVGRIRQQWPAVRIVIRGDGGFCRDHIMTWCEQNDVDYVLGLAKNKRLLEMMAKPMQEAQALFEQCKEASRVYQDLQYRTLDSWSAIRRVVGKAEHLAKGANPRFVVTSIPRDQIDAASLYEKEYCARGEMENRIKEQQLCLFADRTSAKTLRANQLRMYFSVMAYTLLMTLRQKGLAGTSMENARCDTIRLKLLKIGVLIRVTVRRVWLSLSSAYPYQPLFAQVLQNLRENFATPMRC
jgi:Transposase DDE domain group 1